MGSKKKNKNKSKDPAPKETHDALWPTTFKITARNIRSSELAGVIFGCKHSTIKECFDKQLFGLPSLHFVYIRNTKPGFPLFLFNYSDRTLHGIFEAKSAGEMNIDRHAWISETDQETTPFPAQVRFVIKMRCQPVSEDQFKPIISGNYYTEKYFWNELDSVQTKNLIDLFSSLPRTGISSTNSRSVVKMLKTHESKQKLGSKGAQDSEVKCDTTSEKWEQKGNLDSVWNRSFASVVSNNIMQSSPADGSDNSNSRVGFAESDVRSTGFVPEVYAPDSAEVKHIKSDELQGFGKQKGEQQFSDDRISYSSLERNRNKCPETNICKTTTSACNSSQSDQQNLEPGLFWDNPYWGCENYSSPVAEEREPGFSNIAREDYTQSKVKSDNFSSQIPCDNGWDDFFLEAERGLPVVRSGLKPSPPTQTLRTSQTNKLEWMNCMPSIQQDILDRSTEWNPLWDAMQLGFRENVQTPKAEIKTIKHTLATKLDPSASVFCLDKGSSSVTPSYFVSEDYGSNPGSEYGADCSDVDEYLTACSEFEDSPSLTMKKITEYIRNAKENNYEMDNEFPCSSRFDFYNSHTINKIIPQMLDEVESLKASQMEQAQHIHFLEEELAESKEEVRELKQKINVLEFSSSPALPIKNLEYQLSSGLEKIFKDSIFLVGGFNGSSWISSVDCFVPSSDYKVSLSPLNNKRCATTATKLNSELYVLGGKDINSYWCCNTVDSYNFLSNQWVERPPLSKRKKGLTAVSVSSKMFSIGGVDEMSQFFSDVEMFDQDLGRWIPVKSMRQKRVGSTSAEMNGIIYVVGGYDGSNYMKSVERFDPREHGWSLIKSMSTPRWGHSMAVLNDRLFVMGGYDGGQVVETVEVFDPRKGEWMTCEAMNSCRGYAGAVVIGQSIYVMGGASNSNKMLETVECYTKQHGWQVTDLKSVGTRCSFSAIVM